jgi:hypothetical protein
MEGVPVVGSDQSGYKSIPGQTLRTQKFDLEVSLEKHNLALGAWVQLTDIPIF